MSAYGSGRAKDTDFRRTWNKEEYAAKAKARESRDKFAEKNDERRKLGLPALKQKRIEEDDDEPKELMKIREKKIDLDSNIGKIQVVQDSKQPGYYCKHCDITVKDSINYLDHINGRKHLQNVGVSMKVEKASLGSVQERLAMLKRKKENPKQEQYDLDERLQALKQQEEEEKEKRREKKKQKKELKKKKDEPEEDDEMAAMMGFAGFGSSKS